LEPLGDGICRTHFGYVGLEVVDVGYRLDVRPGEFEAVEHQEEFALCVVRVEEGVRAHESSVADAGGIADPR
jgi:hypothetical protein